MTCPYCQEPMEEGLIQSARTIIWSRRKKEFFFIPTKDDLTLAKGMNGSYKEAHFCKKCHKIIFDVID